MFTLVQYFAFLVSLRRLGSLADQTRRSKSRTRTSSQIQCSTLLMSFFSCTIMFTFIDVLVILNYFFTPPPPPYLPVEYHSSPIPNASIELKQSLGLRHSIFTRN